MASKCWAKLKSKQHRRGNSFQIMRILYLIKFSSRCKKANSNSWIAWLSKRHLVIYKWLHALNSEKLTRSQYRLKFCIVRKILKYATLCEQSKATQFELVFALSRLKSLAFGAVWYWKVTVNSVREPVFRETAEVVILVKTLCSIASTTTLDELRLRATNGFCDQFDENHWKVRWNVFNTPCTRTFEIPA